MVAGAAAERTVRDRPVMAALLAALPGCQKSAGPAEQAGREVDRVAIGQQIAKAGDSIEEAARGEKK